MKNKWKNKMIELTQQKNPIPDNLPDQQQEQLEQSALTQDKSSNIDSSNQPNDLQKSFANAETFEEQKNKDQQQTIGESSSINTSQTQQISSNQQNQLTQQLEKDSHSDDINQKSSKQSNEQRTLSEIASFIDQNIKAALDLEQTEENENDLPALENDPNNQQTQIYAHAKNIPQDFSHKNKFLIQQQNNKQRILMNKMSFNQHNQNQ